MKLGTNLGCLSETCHSRMHESPNLVMLEHETCQPVEVISDIHSYEANKSHGEHVTKLKEYIQHAHDIIRIHLLVTVFVE